MYSAFITFVKPETSDLACQAIADEAFFFLEKGRGSTCLVCGWKRKPSAALRIITFERYQCHSTSLVELFKNPDV